MTRRLPWIKLFARDYLANRAVRRLSPDQRGALIDAWLVLAEAGPLPAEELATDLRRLNGPAVDLGPVLALLRDEGGLLLAPRIEEAREGYARVCAANAARARRRWKGPTGSDIIRAAFG